MGIGTILFLPVSVGGEGGKERTYSFTRTGFGRYLFIVESVFFSACIVGFVCTFAKEWFAASRYCCRLGGCIVT